MTRATVAPVVEADAHVVPVTLPAEAPLDDAFLTKQLPNMLAQHNLSLSKAQDDDARQNIIMSYNRDIAEIETLIAGLKALTGGNMTETQFEMLKRAAIYDYDAIPGVDPAWDAAAEIHTPILDAMTYDGRSGLNNYIPTINNYIKNSCANAGVFMFP